MQSRTQRLRTLVEALTSFLEAQHRRVRASLTAQIDAVKCLQAGSADLRFGRLLAELSELRSLTDQIAKVGRAEYLQEIEQQISALDSATADGPLISILSAFRNVQKPSPGLFCQVLLDGLIEATGATRGFILSYIPQSTEAEVLAARNFHTRNIALEEYVLSRTLLMEAFSRSEPLLVEDAYQHPIYSLNLSVVSYELRSVLIVPIKSGNDPVGAVYLDNNAVPAAFDESHSRTVDFVVQALGFYLGSTLAAAAPEGRGTTLVPSRASNEILGRDAKMLRILTTVQRIADRAEPVLIEGESGTGKELVARALHFQGTRKNRPFIAINCAAIPDNLLESELFGHERGAYTGAGERFVGHIQQAEHGTLFLDEVNELPYPMQAKLLRFLESGEFRRLGGRETVRTDVRIVAATGKNLKQLVDAGKFHEALYYRLNVIPIVVPPLRERRQDIPLLLDYFLTKYGSAQPRVEIDP